MRTYDNYRGALDSKSKKYITGGDYTVHHTINYTHTTGSMKMRIATTEKFTTLFSMISIDAIKSTL